VAPEEGICSNDEFNLRKLRT